MKQPPTLHLDPYCWYHCYYPDHEGQPRQATDNAHCECDKPGCQHGQQIITLKMVVPA